MKKKNQVTVTEEEYLKQVSDGINNVAKWVIDDAERFIKLHREYVLAMSALRLFKNRFGNINEFDEIWDEWKGKPFGFHFDVYPNSDGTKMIVTFIDDEITK